MFYRSGLEPDMECNGANLRAIWGGGRGHVSRGSRARGVAYFLKSRWHFSGGITPTVIQGNPSKKAASISAAVSYTTREMAKPNVRAGSGKGFNSSGES